MKFMAARPQRAGVAKKKRILNEGGGPGKWLGTHKGAHEGLGKLLSQLLLKHSGKKRDNHA